MSVKQDRGYARTASDLERKYNFGRSFAEVIGLATDARDAAIEAGEAVERLDAELGADEIFDRLTNNGQTQGIYRQNGQIYINANFIQSGSISSDLIKAGKIRSADFSSEAIHRIYPDGTIYPSASLFPNDGEIITRGIEIDFEAGVIRGVFFYDVTDALTRRIAALEAAVFH